MNAFVKTDQEHEFERANAATLRWMSFLVAEVARRQYREERKLSEQLGFDVVEIGGEG